MPNRDLPNKLLPLPESSFPASDPDGYATYLAARDARHEELKASRAELKAMSREERAAVKQEQRTAVKLERQAQTEEVSHGRKL